uniref:Laminin EGF-like domain-containing protein n=1 Tax=Hucho hucho TaxID=62062 RepID=A0A4W5KTJ5_9TELE
MTKMDCIFCVFLLLPDCECNVEGTVAGVAECAQNNGQCHCKPNVCSGTCSVCKDGYFNLQSGSFFGCQGNPSTTVPPAECCSVQRTPEVPPLVQ